ncbi:hypothetical protein EIP86_002015 [Pleurotus ostreatoroseus]|nr:hypothetical protein EIP86_002015 [Pleurotus ostreatoroseus]
MTTIPRRNVRPLTSSQERKLLDYIEEKFLNVTRNFKKRSDPSSTLQTLSAYLTETHALLSFIMQIPPVDPSASLRTSLLLRLTSEVMNSITGYKPDVQTLPQLLDWFNDLDNAWLAVLRFQAWDTDTREGKDVVIDSSEEDGPSFTSSPISQTERTRLRSLLVTGTASMEEWLVALEPNQPEEDYTSVLEKFGLQQGFDDLFTGVLAEMGSLDGSMNRPEGMEGTC